MLKLGATWRSNDVEVPGASLYQTKSARGKAGKVFWLNPIPERKWKYLNSSQTMAELCTMISCSTLEELGAACRRLAFS